MLNWQLWSEYKKNPSNKYLFYLKYGICQKIEHLNVGNSALINPFYSPAACPHRINYSLQKILKTPLAIFAFVLPISWILLANIRKTVAKMVEEKFEVAKVLSNIER